VGAGTAATRVLGRVAAAARVAWGASGAARRVAGGPLYAQISISDACDHRCVMCPYHPPTEPRAPTRWFGGAQPGLMAKDVYARVVRELAALGTRRVDLVGRGEPLLHPDVVAMVRLARDAGLDVAITSNGSRLDAAMAEALVEAGVTALRVSVDAGTPATYATVHVGAPPESLARLVKGIAHASRHRAVHAGLGGVGGRAGRAPKLTVSFTLGRENAGELDAMIDLALEARADAAFFQHVLPMTDRARAMALDAPTWEAAAREVLPGLAQRAARAGLETNLDELRATAPTPADEGTTPSRCYVGYYFTVVLASGAVLPCCQTEAPLGDAAATGFADVWRGERYERFRRAARRLPESNEALATSACDRCYFRPHNLAVDRVVRPFADRAARTGSAASPPAVTVDQLVRMSRVRGR
jgi:MoaA/NifB/PqqE/SkfB family radical SAM enzyme